MPGLTPPTLGLQANPAPNTIGLVWTDPNTTETSTEIQRMVDAGVFTTVGTLAKNVVTWVDTQLPVATSTTITVTYRVRARGKRGATSAWSNTVAAIIKPAQYTYTVHFIWNSNPEPEVTGYKIYAGRSSGVYDETTKDVGLVTQGYYTILRLPDAGPWYFALTAYTATQESGPSSEASIVITAR